MSYCRWSSQDGWSDVYVYEAEEGWWVHVAGKRKVIDWAALPAPVEDREVGWVERFLARKKVVDAIYSAAPWEPVPAGRQATLHGSPGQAAAHLAYLATLGVHVPLAVIDALDEEQELMMMNKMNTGPSLMDTSDDQEGVVG